MTSPKIVTVEEAQARIVDLIAPLPSIRIPLAESLGLVMAEDVISDVDSPPHDKALVDGYAVVAQDASERVADLEILEEVTAGALPQKQVTPGTTTRIMTGAPVPTGADAVVMLEQTELVRTDIVRCRPAKIDPGQNVMPQGTSLRRGEQALGQGMFVRPVEIGILAEVGCSTLSVVPRPKIAVVATGNELVPLDQIPSAGNLRNSNGPMLVACVHRADARPVDLGIATDDPKVLAQRASQGLDADILLLSGGVSAGVQDYVPKVLTELGVRQVFHKVSVRPGKPVWFGVYETDSRRTLVFGLPGNPVSSLVGFELFVRLAIESLSGRPHWRLPRSAARLAAPHEHRGSRPTFHPAQLGDAQGNPVVELVAWHGSADLASLRSANALVNFPAGTRGYKEGDSVEVVPLH